MLRELLAVHVPLLDDGGLRAARGKQGPVELAALEGGWLQGAPQNAARGDRHSLRHAGTFKEGSKTHVKVAYS